MRIKLIYDFDDAIWLTDRLVESRWEKVLRNRSKVSRICSWSQTVVTGNEYLARYARQFNDRVSVIPTTIDTGILVERPQLQRESAVVTIGWTGTHSTLKYLDDFITVFQELSDNYQIRLLVISDLDPGYDLDNYQFLEWNREVEIDDLLQVDIGIMPMPDDTWTRGKCGFKAFIN